MKVLHLATHPMGATFRATLQFHKYLKSKGYNSIIMTARGEKRDSNYIPYFLYGIRKLSISRIFRKFVFEKILNDKDYYFYPDWNLDNVNAKTILNKIPFDPNIIILYWTKFFLNPEIIFNLYKITNAKIFWYLMDMNAFTGGCNYSYDCDNYKRTCGYCPALRSKKSNDLSHKLLMRKMKFFSKLNLDVISPSSTLAHQSSASTVFKDKKIHNVLLGINSKIFEARNRSKVRQSLNLPVNKKIIFFGAQHIDSRRKGMYYLKKSLELLFKKMTKESRNEILLVYAGKKGYLKFPFNSIHAGYLDQYSLAKYYQAADIFVCPSVEDSGPSMINEALMCGTPVVSFNMGVAPDLIHNEISGYKAELKNIHDLAYGISSMLELSKEEKDIISENCRKIAIEKTELNKQNELLLKILMNNKNKG